MMTNLGFTLEQSCMLVFKNIKSLHNTNLSLNNFDVKTWDIPYEDLIELDYFNKFNNKIVRGFTYINLCEDVYNDLVSNSNLISINGYKAIVKHKGDFASIMCIDVCITNPTISLVEDLKSHIFECLDEFVNDCLYFVYR